jgi:hypothetical protein
MTDDLRLLNPDPGRSARVVARCRQVMTRRAARRRVPRDVLVERVIVGGFALIYLAAIVGIAVSVRGIGY